MYGGLAVVVAAAVALALLVQCAGRRPAEFAVTMLVILVVLASAIWIRKARRDAYRRRWAELTRSIAATDWLTGPQFEHWLAALMRRTGFTRVQVCGGAGDLGADITAYGPTRRRVVI